jgi:hypothetical protein
MLCLSTKVVLEWNEGGGVGSELIDFSISPFQSNTLLTKYKFLGGVHISTGKVASLDWQAPS